MRRIAVAASSFAVVLLTAGVLAQARPSFAGRWVGVVGPAPQDAARHVNPGWTDGYRWYPGTIMVPAEPIPLTIVQDERTLTVTTVTPASKIVYNLDGSASRNWITMEKVTVELSSTVKWTNNKLVITTTITRDGERRDSTATWSLDAAGSLVIESTSGGRTEPPVTTKMTYKKAPGGAGPPAPAGRRPPQWQA